MMLSLILLDEPSDSFAGVFTRNKFPGNPVLLGKKRLATGNIRGVLINNRIANVCTGSGMEDIDCLLNELGKLAGADPEDFFSSSTGIIGWKLPVDEMVAAVPGVISELVRGSALKLARGIMTTDSFPKLRSAEIGDGRVLAIAKGAGMIEPNMATMLCFILTDVDIPRETLRRLLPGIVNRTFNRISIDSDQSTSDMVLAFSSGKAGEVEEDEFSRVLEGVLKDLAGDIVRNGEGTSHVIRVVITSGADPESAQALARAVVNSPLVKTAVAGNDPNVGRIISSLGDCAGNGGYPLVPERVTVSLGGTPLFRNNRFELDPDRENKMTAYLKDARLQPDLTGYPEHNRTVDIEIDLGLGDSCAEVLGSDLTHEYVTENADYRT